MSNINAQDDAFDDAYYRTSIGVKVGNRYQASAKCFINKDMAFDISGGFSLDNSAPVVAMLFEYHHDTQYENVIWYYGAGPIAALQRQRNELGFSGVFGGEIVTLEKFITIFAEIQPIVTTPLGRFSFTNQIVLNPKVIFSAGARYILN